MTDRSERALKMKALGGKLFGLSIACMVCGRIVVAIFLPEQVRQGLTPSALVVLVPIWSIGIVGLGLFCVGSMIAPRTVHACEAISSTADIAPPVEFFEEIFFDLQGFRRLLFDASQLAYVADERWFMFSRPTATFIPYNAIRSIDVVRKRQWWALLMGIVLTPCWLSCMGFGASESNWGMTAVAAVWLLVTGVFPLWLFFRGRPFLAITSDKKTIKLPLDRHKAEVSRAIVILKRFVTSHDVHWGLSDLN